MKKDDHYLLGSLLKTTGIKGEIVLKLNNDCLEEIQELESIFINVDEKLVPFFIENIQAKSSITIVIKLEGLDSDSKSSEFIGSEVYISPQQAKMFSIEQDNQFISIVGYKIINPAKELIGTVVEFVDVPENPLLNIKTEKGEVLIPANEELIIEIDDNLRIIEIDIPEGLLEIE